MAEEKLQYTLELATRSTGDGAKRTADDLSRVRSEMDEAKTAASSFRSSMAGVDSSLTRTTNTSAGLQRGLVASRDRVGNLGSVVNQAGYQFTDFAIQVQSGTSAVTAFAQQAPQLAGALSQAGILAGGVGTAISVGVAAGAIGFQVLSNSYRAMMADIDNAKKAEENYNAQLRANSDLRKQIAERNRADFISSALAKETEYLERQVEALERINELRAAQGDSAAVRANAAVTIAQNTGGDVTGAKANAIAIGVDNQLDALASKLATGEAALASAVQDFDKKRTFLAEALRLSGGVETQEVFDASQAAAAAENTVAEARAALDNLRAITAEQRAAIAAGAEAQISELAAGLRNDIEDKTKTFVEGAAANINAVVDASGPALAADAKGAIDRFQNLINDTIPDSQQMDAITASVRQFRGSQSTMLSGLTENFDELLRQSGGIISEVSRQKTEIARLRGQIEQLLGL